MVSTTVEGLTCGQAVTNGGTTAREGPPTGIDWMGEEHNDIVRLIFFYSSQYSHASQVILGGMVMGAAHLWLGQC